MASNRHLGRIIVLQTLYEYEFRHEAGDGAAVLDDILARNLARYKDYVDDQAFVKRLVSSVAEAAGALDTTLQPLAPEWPIDQIARMDRTILHIGLYELQQGQDVPPKVVINEAVELAKAFGGDNSSKFVNGVLGTYYRQNLEPAADKDTPDAAPKAAKPAKKAKK